MKTVTEKLLELKRIKKGLEIYKEKTERNRILELDMRKEELELKYDRPLQNAIKNIEYYSNQIKEINEKIIKYSVFNSEVITNILRILIRVYEGKNFVSREVRYNDKIAQKARILINDEKLSYIDRGYCDKNKLNSIQKNSDGIILDWDISLKKYIQFYTLSQDMDLKYNVRLNKFSYIKDFIDYVIEYYYINNITEEVTEDKLFELMQVFISEHIDEVKNHHKEIKNKEEEKMKKQIEENSEYRAKQLNKVLDRFYGGDYEIRRIR